MRGVDLLLATFEALPEADQKEAFERLQARRLRDQAGDDSITGQMLRCLIRAAEYAGQAEPTVEQLRGQPLRQR